MHFYRISNSIVTSPMDRRLQSTIRPCLNSSPFSNNKKHNVFFHKIQSFGDFRHQERMISWRTKVAAHTSVYQMTAKDEKGKVKHGNWFIYDWTFRMAWHTFMINSWSHTKFQADNLKPVSFSFLVGTDAIGVTNLGRRCVSCMYTVKLFYFWIECLPCHVSRHIVHKFNNVSQLRLLRCACAMSSCMAWYSHSNNPPSIAVFVVLNNPEPNSLGFFHNIR